MAAFVGPKPEKLDVNHINGIKTDNKLSNLEYTTRTENHFHAHRLGLARHGEKHHRAKLSTDDVLNIRSMGDNYSHRELAKIFGVDKSTIHYILKNKIWKYA